MKRLVLHPETALSAHGQRERRCTLERLDGGASGPRETLFFRFPETAEALADNDAESYLLATLMLAMREGRDILVRGEVTDTLLANLSEYMQAWHCWLPDEFQRVELHAEQVRCRELVRPAPPGTLCAFSGGVDATFLVWSHARQRRGHANRRIDRAMFIHGYEIPLDQPGAFDRAFVRADTTLRSIGLPLSPIATNVREITERRGGVQWIDSFATAVAACFQQFKSSFDTALLASSEPYDSLVIPLGSSPLTDHLLSSRDLQILHDGAAWNRTAKVRGLADWPEGLDGLRVCALGELKYENCGVCEKCLRTRLNFMANGLVPPASLKGAPTLAEIWRHRVKGPAALSENRKLLREARANGVGGAWLAMLRLVLLREPLRNALRSLNRNLQGKPPRR